MPVEASFAAMQLAFVFDLCRVVLVQFVTVDFPAIARYKNSPAEFIGADTRVFARLSFDSVGINGCFSCRHPERRFHVLLKPTLDFLPKHIELGGCFFAVTVFSRMNSACVCLVVLFGFVQDDVQLRVVGLPKGFYFADGFGHAELAQQSCDGALGVEAVPEFYR